MNKLSIFALVISFMAAMADVATATIWASWVVDVKDCAQYGVYEEDGGNNALGPPDFEDGNKASGWASWTGHLTLGFDSSLIDGEGNDLVIYHYRVGKPEVLVSEDLATWTSLGYLSPNISEVISRHDFDFAVSGVDFPVNYVKIDKTQYGWYTGKFIDAVGGLYPAETDPNNARPCQPISLSPGDGQTAGSMTPELKIDAFSDDDGDTHSRTRWQISTDKTFSSIVYDCKSTSCLTLFPVPELLLDKDTTYYWRAKFRDNRNAQSLWSVPFQFTTPHVDNGDANGNGIPDNQEVVDDTVDLDGEGGPDNNQDGMKCVNAAAVNAQIGVKISSNVRSIESISWFDPDTIPESDTKPNGMQFGLISFKLKILDKDDPAKVIVYFSRPVPSGAKWCKYDPIKEKWSIFSEDHARFSSDGTFVTLTLEDGGDGDTDGVKNGVILDPGGPAVPDVFNASCTLFGAGKDTTDEEGCFIATAAYGSVMHPHVKILREFRDRVLLSHRAGKGFVDLYYSWSPSMADFIAGHAMLRQIVRVGLLPVIAASWVVLNCGLLPCLTFMILLLTLICVFTVDLVTGKKYCQFI